MVLETCPELSAPNDPLIDIRVGWLPSTSALSASIAFYRPKRNYLAVYVTVS